MKLWFVLLLITVTTKLYAPDIDKRQWDRWQLASIDIMCIEESKFTRILNAIIKIESGGDSCAYNGKEDAVGILQIRKVYVDEVNRISHKKFEYKDRWSIEKSIEMFKILNDKHVPSYNIDTVAHVHNGGAYRLDKRWKYTASYRKKVNQFYR